MRSLFALSLFAILSTTAWGQLNPPGAPTNTSPSLSEIANGMIQIQAAIADQDPRTPVNIANTPGGTTSTFEIDEPGSYYLTENISGVSAKDGIEISADGVTLDLNGFTLNGNGVGRFGILVTANFNVTVRNGTISHWTAEGIYNQSCQSAQVENVNSSRNEESGFENAEGMSTAYVSCTAASNEADGFNVGAGTLADCLSTNNNRGFQLNGGATAQNCVALDNVGDGFDAGDGSALTDCTAQSNGDEGMRASGSATFRGCLAHANVSTGFGGSSSVFDSCVARENGGSGFNVGGALFTECLAFRNVLSGFSIGGSALALNCVSNQNGSDPGNEDAGFRITGDDTVVRDCVADNNDIGIYASAVIDGCRIEGNHLSDNDSAGIQMLSANNVMVGNSARGNLKGYSIEANTFTGNLITNSAQVPNAGPWDNFDF